MHDLPFEHQHLSAEEQQEIAEAVFAMDNVVLTTVGLDIGSSTSHLMFAKVHLQRLQEGLSSRFVVVNREVLWRSPILLTPYRSDYTIDVAALKAFFDQAYRSARVSPDQIDTGAVILTGEALKRVNARAIADLFASETGKFVCASAGHHLEAVMAAHGSGAVAISQSGQTILNVDIGGGTVKLGLCQGGRLLATSAFAVGGRLIAFDDAGAMARIEGPAEQVAADLGLTLALGRPLSAEGRRAIVKRMTDVIVAHVNRRSQTDPLAQALALTDPLPAGPPIDALTFSGGVSEFIYKRETADHGDIGKALAHQIAHALEDRRLAFPTYDPGHGIRATVIGASQFTVQVSGNTIFISSLGQLPIRNVPVARLDLDLSGDFAAEDVAGAVRAALARIDHVEGTERVALALKWAGDPMYARLFALAQGIAKGMPLTAADPDGVLIVVMDGDAGRTLGTMLAKDCGVRSQVISIDNVVLSEFDFIDVGALIPETRVVPLIIKSLLFNRPGHQPGR